MSDSEMREGTYYLIPAFLLFHGNIRWLEHSEEERNLFIVEHSGFDICFNKFRRLVCKECLNTRNSSGCNKVSKNAESTICLQGCECQVVGGMKGGEGYLPSQQGHHLSQ